MKNAFDWLRHRPWVAHFQKGRLRRKEREALEAWISKCASENSQIDSSVEFIGHKPPTEKVKLGTSVRIESGVTIWLANDSGANSHLSIGSGVFVGKNSHLGSYFPIEVGNNVMIGAGSYIVSGNHRFETRSVPMSQQGFSGAAIKINDDVWLGARVVILPGVTIGKGAIIGAGSVVNKSVPDYEIWGGVPARFLKQRP